MISGISEAHGIQNETSTHSQTNSTFSGKLQLKAGIPWGGWSPLMAEKKTSQLHSLHKESCILPILDKGLVCY